MLKSWNQFTRRILINSSIEDIYPLWTTSKGLTSWFLSSAKYVSSNGEQRDNEAYYEKGDRYIWKWHNWDGSAHGTVLEQNGTNHIRFEFEDSIVHVQLSTYEDGRTLVSLIQSEIPETEEHKMNSYCGCSAGWTFWLTNLKAFCEYGIVLNEKGTDLTGKFDGYQLVNT